MPIQQMHSLKERLVAYARLVEERCGRTG